MKLSFQADRDPEINSRMFAITRDVMVKAAIKEGILADDDLAEVPEVMPYFFKLAGALRDDIYEVHNKMKKPLQFPIIQNCFCYSFGKGAESAFLWKVSSDGKITFNYAPDAAINGLPTPDDSISDEFVEIIGYGMDLMPNVFVDFQNKVLINKKKGFADGGRLTADVISCGLYWSAAIGLDYCMNKLGYP